MKIKLPLRKAGPLLKRPPQLKLKASVASRRRAPIIEEEDFLEEPEPNMKLSHAFVVVLVLHVIAVAGVFAFNSIKAQREDIFSAIKEEPVKAAAAAETAIASSANPAAALESPIQPESVKPNVSEPAPIAASKTHELQPGETLTKVARTHGVSVADLLAANEIPDERKIRAGTMLVIPGKQAPAAAAPAKPESQTYKPFTPAPIAEIQEPPAKPVALAPPSAVVTKDSGAFYVVVKGDNPVKIAKHLKVTYAELLALNNITDPRKLQIGQKLKVPAKK